MAVGQGARNGEADGILVSVGVESATGEEAADLRVVGLGRNVPIGAFDRAGEGILGGGGVLEVDLDPVAVDRGGLGEVDGMVERRGVHLDTHADVGPSLTVDSHFVGEVGVSSVTRDTIGGINLTIEDDLVVHGLDVFDRDAHDEAHIGAVGECSADIEDHDAVLVGELHGALGEDGTDLLTIDHADGLVAGLETEGEVGGGETDVEAVGTRELRQVEGLAQQRGGDIGEDVVVAVGVVGIKEVVALVGDAEGGVHLVLLCADDEDIGGKLGSRTSARVGFAVVVLGAGGEEGRRGGKDKE